MKKIAGAVCTALLAMGLHTAPALAADVTVTLPSFPVTLNGVTMEQSQSQYPMLVYKDITYVPMTWADTRLLGLDSSWTQQTGLVIDKAAEVPDQKTAQSSYKPYKAGTANAKSYTATIASGKITVNGKSINNSKEEYPLLLFRDVTYFPLTWRFAVTEFDWNYNFDAKNGLVIAPKPTASSGSGNVNTKGEIIGQKVTVTGSGVNLRDDAGTSSSAVGTAQKGETLIVTGTKIVDGKTWYQVMRPSGDSNLWIASWYTEKSAGSSSNSGSSGGNSVSTSTGSGASNTTSTNSMVGKTIAVTGSVVNLRANTNTTSAVLGQAVKGETFTVLSEKTVGGDTWYQVKMKSGVKVWIAGWLTAESKGNAGSSTNTGTNTNTGSSSGTSSSSMVGQKIMVNATGVNLRTDAGTSHTIAGTVNKGVTFTVLAQKTVDGKVWYQVKYGSNNVWIASWLTEKYTASSTGSSSSGSVTAEKTRLRLQSVKEQSGKTIVTLYKGAGNSYSTTKATANQLVLQLNNVYMNTADSINQSYSGPLQHLQVQDAGENALKVTLDLQKDAYCTVKEDGDTLVITAYRKGTGLNGKVIVIDPGHGGSDPGAIGRVLGVTDAEVGLTVGLKLRDLLEDAGATVLMTRETDVRLGLPERSDMANKAEADLFISIHANSSTNTVPKGIQIYYYAPSSNANLYAQSYVRKTLAENVSENMQAATGTVSDVRTANYAVLRENDRPSILVETGFLSNAEEEALLAQDSYRQKLAEGIYNGVETYFD